MDSSIAYLVGMLLGNGEIQKKTDSTIFTIDIPYKNIRTDDDKDVQVYVKSSLLDIRSIIDPIVGGGNIKITSTKNSTKLSFTGENSDPYVKELYKYIGTGTRQQNMKMTDDVFALSTDHRKSLLRGLADVTAYIRKSNVAFGQLNHHRVYIEIPQNWQMVIDIANLLKSVDIPVHAIDFAHPNFRDSNLKEYKNGHPNFWKKEHQIKIYANEFLPIGFNIQHKQDALVKYANLLLTAMTPQQTHKYYWETTKRTKDRPSHPGENDTFIPKSIRGKHYNSWRDLAKDLGYHE